MTMNFSMNTVFYVWRHESSTVRTFLGTVQALTPEMAAALATDRWGASHYGIRAFRSGRTLLTV